MSVYWILILVFSKATIKSYQNFKLSLIPHLGRETLYVSLGE